MPHLEPTDVLLHVDVLPDDSRETSPTEEKVSAKIGLLLAGANRTDRMMHLVNVETIRQDHSHEMFRIWYLLRQ